MSGPSKQSPPLTPVVYHTLLALVDGPLHGYAISQDVEEGSGGSVRMGPGTLYGTLQRMQKAGLLKEAAAPPDSDATHEERRRYYELTPRGHSTLRAEAERLENAVRIARARSVLGGSDVG